MNHIFQMRRSGENSPEETPAAKPSKPMSDERKRTIVVWTTIVACAIAYYGLGFGYWPSAALGAAVWVAMHLLLGVKMKKWA